MEHVSFAAPVAFGMTGQFAAPSSEWVHDTRDLSDYELIVMSEGVLYIAYAGREYVVSPGQYLLLPPSVKPGDMRVGYRPSACGFYWLHFTPAQSGEGVIELPAHHTLPFPEKALVLLRQLQDYVRSGYNDMARGYMATTILLELYNQANWPRLGGTPHKKQLYNDIVDYIKRHIHEPLRVADIATEFGYHEKYLGQLFHGLVGIPLKQYILKLKAEQANFYLTDSNRSITEIAVALGFPDGQSFAKAYKKSTGLTPSEYRNAFSQRLLFHS